MRHRIHHLLICGFLDKPYPVLYFTIVFPNVATFIKDFRIELYQWLDWRSQRTVNNLLLRMPDDFRNQYQETLLISAQNFLSLSSTEFAPELFIKDFQLNRYTSDESFEQIKFRLLTGYVDSKIKFQLFPILRQLTGDDTIGHSNVGIAARASCKKVKSSLKRAVYNEEKIEKYMFFFNRFKEVNNSELLPSQLTINKWTEKNYQQVADRYNEIKLEYWESINGAQAKKMLEEIGQAIRDYERSFIASHTVDIDDHSVESEVISSEHERSFTLDLCNFIRDLLCTLNGSSNPEINRRIIFAILNHGFNINQVDIAEQYEQDKKRQYIVSRELNKLYQEIAKRYFKHCYIQPSSEQIDSFIKLLKNTAVDNINLDMPILKRVFVDDFEQVFSAYIITSHTTITMKTNMMTSQVEHQYNITLDEVAKNYLSHWIEEKLSHL